MKIFYLENVRMPSERAHAYQIAQTCAWLARLGDEVTLVNPDRARGADVFEAFGLPKNLFAQVTLKSWDPLSSARFPFKAPAYNLQRWAFVRALRRWVGSQSADAWYTRDPAMVDALKDIVSGPWFLELHDAPDNDPARWRRIRERVRGFIAISRGLRDKLISLGIPAERILVAHDGFDPELFKVAGDRAKERESLSIPKDAFVAIYAGSFYPWKGVELAVRAWGKTDESSHLVLVGGPEGDRRRISSLVKPEYAARVHILPTASRERVIAMLAAADAGLLTSSKEEAIGRLYTSPLKQFEYLAAGLPVLASDVPSSHEILDRRTARFYEPSEEGFLQALEAFRRDAAWRETARGVCREVAAPYTWEARTLKIERFINTYK